MRKKIIGILVSMLFLTTIFAGVHAYEIKSNDPKKNILVNVWITSVSYSNGHGQLHVRVCGDSDDDDYGNLWIKYRKDVTDTWHFGDDEAACPGCVEETWSYSSAGHKTVYIRLCIGHYGYYESDIWTIDVDITPKPKLDSLILQKVLGQYPILSQLFQRLLKL